MLFFVNKIEFLVIIWGYIFSKAEDGREIGKVTNNIP